MRSAGRQRTSEDSLEHPKEEGVRLTTNIELLAEDIMKMKHRRKILSVLPLFLEVRIQHSGDGAQEPAVLSGDVAAFPNPASLLQHAG